MAQFIAKIKPDAGEFYFAAENVVRYRCRFRLTELPYSFQCVDPDADSLVVASGIYYPERHYEAPSITGSVPSDRWNEYYAEYFGYESYGLPLGATWDESRTQNHVTNPIDFPITPTGIAIETVDESSPWSAHVMDQIECLPPCDGTQFMDRPDTTFPTIDSCSSKTLTARWAKDAFPGAFVVSGTTATVNGPGGIGCKVDQPYLQAFEHSCVTVHDPTQPNRLVYEWRDRATPQDAGGIIASLLPLPAGY